MLPQGEPNTHRNTHCSGAVCAGNVSRCYAQPPRSRQSPARSMTHTHVLLALQYCCTDDDTHSVPVHGYYGTAPDRVAPHETTRLVAHSWLRARTDARHNLSGGRGAAQSRAGLCVPWVQLL